MAESHPLRTVLWTPVKLFKTGGLCGPSYTLKDRFHQKDYPHEGLEQEMEIVSELGQHTLFSSQIRPDRPNNSHEQAFLTIFYTQYHWINRRLKNIGKF